MYIKNFLRRHGIDPEKDVELVVSSMNSWAMQKPLLDSGKTQGAMILKSEAAAVVAEDGRHCSARICERG